MSEQFDEHDDFVEEVSKGDVALKPSDAADPSHLLKSKIPADILGAFEVHSYRNAAVSEKYGASTTWMGKLLYRLNAGRNGGCPVLVIGITPNQIDV